MFNFQYFKPDTAWITVNNFCNLKCVWCYTEENLNSANQYLSFGLAKKIIDGVKTMGIKTIIFIGGEPTLWKHLFDVITYCKELDIETCLVTNALMFSNDAFWEKYKQNSCNFLSASIKASNEYDFEIFTKSNRFKSSKLSLIRALSLPNSGAEIVFSDLNKSGILTEVAFAKSIGAKSVVIEFCSPTFNDHEVDSKYVPSIKDTVDTITSIHEEISRTMGGMLAYEMNLPFCIWPKRFIEKLISNEQIYSVCHVRKKSGIVFDLLGNILVCNGLHNFPIVDYLDKINNPQEIINSLNSEKVLSQYDELLKMPSKQCSICNYYDYCGGGCPLYWTIFNPSEIINIEKGGKNSG